MTMRTASIPSKDGTADESLRPAMPRIAILITAGMLLGSTRALADVFGINVCSLRKKADAERGVSDDDLRAAADALEARAAALTLHAPDLRDQAGGSVARPAAALADAVQSAQIAHATLGQDHAPDHGDIHGNEHAEDYIGHRASPCRVSVAAKGDQSDSVEARAA